MHGHSVDPPPAAMWDVSDLVHPVTMRRLVESSLEGLAVIDGDGRWLYVNPAGRGILGVPESEVLGRPAFHNPRQLEVSGSQEPAQIISTTTVVRPDGARRLVEFVATPFASGGTYLTAVSFRDNTDLLRSQRRLSAFAHAAHRITYRGSLGEILDEMAKEVMHAADLAMVQILIFAPEDPTTPVAVYGSAGDAGLAKDFASRAAEVRDNGGELLSTTVIRERQPILRRRRREAILFDPVWAPLHPFFAGFEWSDMIALPLVVDERPLGSFVAYCRPETSPGGADVAFLESMADQAAIAIESAHLFAASKGQAEMEQRHQIARDLHDTISQHLFSVGLHGRTAQLAAAEGGEDRREILDHSLKAVIELSESALADMRDFVFRLYPTLLGERGLAYVVRQYAAAVAARERIEVLVDADDDPIDLDLSDAENAYRIVAEALHNVVKHARARSCRIRLLRGSVDGNSLLLEVSDDGVGLQPCQRETPSFGLLSMRERAERLGGRLEITSPPGGGTTVRAVLPHRDPAEDQLLRAVPKNAEHRTVT